MCGPVWLPWSDAGELNPISVGEESCIEYLYWLCVIQAGKCCWQWHTCKNVIHRTRLLWPFFLTTYFLVLSTVTFSKELMFRNIILVVTADRMLAYCVEAHFHYIHELELNLVCCFTVTRDCLNKVHAELMLQRGCFSIEADPSEASCCHRNKLVHPVQ